MNSEALAKKKKPTRLWRRHARGDRELAGRSAAEAVNFRAPRRRKSEHSLL